MIYSFFTHPERFWNEVIIWALGHIHRAGGVHQDTFYCVLKKCRKDTVMAQVQEMKKNYFGEGWDEE